MLSRLALGVRPSRQLSIFVREQAGEWVRGSDPVEQVIVCLGPDAVKSMTALKSANELAARTAGNTHVRAIHVPSSKKWREDANVSNLLRKATAVATDIDVLDGSRSVKKTIVSELNAQRPDLCVIGADSSSVGIFSTVRYVCDMAPCDVLVVRDDGFASLTSGEPMKALVCFGINDWEGSIEAFKAALRIAKRGDVIEAVHVVHLGGAVDGIFGPPMVAPKGNGTTEEKIAKALEMAMRQALADDSTCLTPGEVKISPVVLYAGIENPIKVLVDYAESSSANLVSVGAGSIWRIFSPKNFSYYLTHKAPCSVLVARRTQQQQSETKQETSNDSRSFYVEDPQEWVRHKSFI